MKQQYIQLFKNPIFLAAVIYLISEIIPLLGLIVLFSIGTGILIYYLENK